MYDDFARGFQGLPETAKNLSSQYQQLDAKLRQVVRMSPDGKLTVDEGALRNVLGNIARPRSANVDRFIASLSLGMAMHDRRPIMPWTMFTDENEARMIAAKDWRAFGFGPDGRAEHPFAGFENVPPAVTSRANLEMLGNAARHPFSIDEMRAKLRGRTAFLENMPALPIGGAGGGGVPVNIPPDVAARFGLRPAGRKLQYSDVHQSQAALNISPEDLKKVHNCFEAAKHSFDWYGWKICMNRECADIVETVLLVASGIGTVMVGQLVINSIKEGVLAALQGFVDTQGGWIQLAIELSLFVWAAMIDANKGSGGVCLHLPGPWTFGVLGAGYAEGF